MEVLLKIDIATLVRSIGYVGLFIIIYAESGVFFGFFLPGGSLLFTTGLLASQGVINIWIVVPLLGLAAILGDNTGYWFGKKVGPRIFSREDSRFFHKSHIERTERFYARYGTRTIVLARFVPIIRTFAPILAGVGRMNYSSFLKYNIIGAVLWAIGVALLGFTLGRTIPGIDKYLVYIILLIIFLTLIPIISEVVKSRKENI